MEMKKEEWFVAVFEYFGSMPMFMVFGQSNNVGA